MRLKRVMARLGVLAVLLPGLSGVVAIEANANADTNSAEAATPVSSCASLSELQLPDTTISPASDAGDTTTPPSCRVHLTVTHPPAGDVVNVWVYLPDTGWNGRFQGVGGGGYVGGREGSLVAPLRQGFAAGATDAGSPGTDASFFLDPDNSINRQRAENWGYLGVHDMTVREGAGRRVLRRRSAVLVLERVLDRRSPGPDGSAALPGRLRRDPRRRAGDQPDRDPIGVDVAAGFDAGQRQWDRAV